MKNSSNQKEWLLILRKKHSSINVMIHTVTLSTLLCKCTQNTVSKKLGHLLYRFYFLFLWAKTFCEWICYQMKNSSNQKERLLISRKKHSSINVMVHTVTLSTLLWKCTQNTVSKKLGHLLYRFYFLFLRRKTFCESICYRRPHQLRLLPIQSWRRPPWK